MATEQFEEGDIVELKSGSPRMLVLWSGEETTGCYYYNPATGIFMEHALTTSYLKKVEGSANSKDSDK